MNFASCCVLSYERPSFLKTAVSTLLEHAGAPLELIVHDDGSSDPQLRDYLAGLSRDGVASTLILNPPGHNEGVGQAVHRCFSMARGDPLIKIDQDLIFRPGWLREINRILYVAGADDDQPSIGALGAFHYHHSPVRAEEMLMRDHGLWEEVQDFVGSLFAIPRAVYEQHGPIETHSEAFAEDVVFKQALQARGYALGLPKTDLVQNQGFGVGPSTVVVDTNEVRSIHRHPVIHA